MRETLRKIASVSVPSDVHPNLVSHVTRRIGRGLLVSALLAGPVKRATRHVLRNLSNRTGDIEPTQAVLGRCGVAFRRGAPLFGR